MISELLRTLSSVGLIIAPTVFIDTLAKATLLLLFALLACAALWRASAASKHYLLGLTVASLCLLPILSAFGPQLRVLPSSWTLALNAQSTLTVGSPSNATESPFESRLESPIDEAASPFPISDVRSPAADLPLVKDSPATASEDATLAVAATAAGAHDQSARTWLPIAWQSFAVLWLLGSLSLLARLAAAMLRLRAAAARATPIDDPSWLSLTEELAANLGVSQRVRLVQSGQAAMPMTWGVWRPYILLPADCDAWSHERKRVVLLHELAHIQRRDSGWLMLTELVRAVYWVHPLVWVAARQMTAYREQACDDRVLIAGHTPIDYAEHLLKIATHNGSTMPSCAAAIGMARANQLEGRIRLILDAARNRSALSRPLTVGLVLLLAAIALPLAMLHAAEQSDSAAPNETSTSTGQLAEGQSEGEPETSGWDPNQVLVYHAVHAETGEDLPGVLLELQNMGPGIDFQDVTTYTTDSQGRAKIKLPAKPPTAVRVYPHKAGFVPLRVYWEREPYPVMPKSVTVPMQTGQPIGGRIQNEAREPIAGATVSLHYWGPGTGKNPQIRANCNDESTKATTDSEGRWRFDSMPDNLDAEELRIYVNHPDYLSDHPQRGYLPTPVIKQPAVSQLYDQTAVMTMRSGVTIEGQIVDKEGQPIPDARIYDRERISFSGDGVRATTDKEGRFRMTGVPAKAFDRKSEYWHLPRQQQPDTLTLTVQASGYAAELVEVDQVDDMLRIELSPGQAVGGQITDNQGKPIEGAYVIPRSWRGYRNRLYLDTKTDKAGRFRLEGVPEDGVEYDFGKDGYLSTEGFSMKPSEEDYRITLRQPVTIRGVVTDAETGEPIRNFSLTRGTDYEDGRAPYWHAWEQRDLTTGEYETTLTQAGFSYRLRVEADGYMPEESRIFRAYDPDEGELTQDFQLQKAKRLSGVVLDLTGKPLANAEVYRARSRLNVTERKVTYADQFDAPPVVTNSEGKFSFPPEVEPFCLVVAHPKGVGMVTEKEFARSPTVQITPWNDDNEQLQIIRRPSPGELVDFPNPSPTSRLRE